MEQTHTHDATHNDAEAQNHAEKCVRSDTSLGDVKNLRDLHGWMVSENEPLALCH